MISQQRAEELANKLLKNTISSEEEQEWQEWYLSNLEDPLEVPEGFAHSRSLHAARMLNKINEEIGKKVDLKRGSGIVPVSLIWKVAAAVAVMSLGLWLYYSSFNPFDMLSLPKHASISATDDIAPGRNTATITFDNGEAIDLNDEELDISSATVEPLKEGSEVASETTQFLANHIAKSKTVVLSTPRGGTYQVVLPDGTKVWLNADTKISFPSRFSGKERKVLLAGGEAYFEVVHNKAMPFIVEGNNQQVKVLGTRFNLKAYKDEDEVRTTLVEGSVEVSAPKLNPGMRYLLKPGEQSIFRNASNGAAQLQKKQVNTLNATAWQQGYFWFEDERLGDIMRQLARWYDIEVRYEGGISDVRFSARVDRNKNISQVLSMLEKTKGVHFKIEGRRVTAIE